MENFNCQFCKKKFSSKSNLSNHIKRAKYCIKNRSEINIKTDIDHKCDSCEKTFTTKYMLQTHILNCQVKKNYDITFLQEQTSKYQKDLEEKNKIITLQNQEIIFLKQQLEKQSNEIESFKKQLGSIALEGIRKPTKITNNTTNTTTNITQILSPFDLDQKDILGILQEKLDENSFLNSQRGIAKFCVDNILKTEDGKMRMICTDPSRERFKYMDKDGVVKEDIQARQFIEKIYPPIHQAGEKLHESIIEKCKTQIMKISRGEDNTEKYLVKVREEAAHNSWVDIRFMKCHTSNGTFRKELALLSNV